MLNSSRLNRYLRRWLCRPMNKKAKAWYNSIRIKDSNAIKDSWKSLILLKKVLSLFKKQLKQEEIIVLWVRLKRFRDKKNNLIQTIVCRLWNLQPCLLLENRFKRKMTQLSCTKTCTSTLWIKVILIRPLFKLITLKRRVLLTKEMIPSNNKIKDWVEQAPLSWKRKCFQRINQSSASIIQINREIQ